MNKKTLIAAITTLLLFTGCGSATPDMKDSSVPSSSSAASSEAKSKYDKAYFADLIQDFPVTIQCYADTKASPKAKEYSLTMSNCTAESIATLDLKEGSITASGLLTNGQDSTSGDIQVTYIITKEKDGSYQITSTSCAVEEPLYLTPSIPFSMDLLYENISAVYVYPKGNIADHTDYPISDFTIELVPECWWNDYRYGGTLYLTDKEGNKYITNTYFGFFYHKGEWRVDNIVMTELMESEK